MDGQHADGLFDVPEHKADPTLTASDERHFAAIAASLRHSVDDLSERLGAARRAPAGPRGQAVERDQEVRSLTSRLRTLRRYSLDLCLGRITSGDEKSIYIGRIGLTGPDGDRLLVDWRSPAAAPFFAATHAHPLGLTSRRRYRWARGRITDYWDEVFTGEGWEGHAALDDQSAFLASLGTTRTEKMRDVLGTIQADQDAIIRAGSEGALVVDGGPGTGKTVVALHRTAYLLYADPRLRQRRGGVLVVGPHQPYLSYVADVLPGLGEDDVQTCTLRDLLPEGAAVADEQDSEVRRLKSSARLVRAVEEAVRFYEEPPGGEYAAAWAEAFSVSGVPHNEAREQIWADLVEITGDEDRELWKTLHRAWPLLDPADVVADLWSVPAYLRRCAPWLTRAEVLRLQRADPRAWTVEDLPFLDAARQRLGDAGTAQRRERRKAATAAQRDTMSRVVDDLLASHEYDDGQGLMPMFRNQDMRDMLVDESVLPEAPADRLAGPFAHIVVDEAQELTDAQWQMLLLRCPSRSFTVVGDRAQARSGFAESWRERLERAGLDRVTLTGLSINYRTPEEVMREAEPVIRAVLPDANVPRSIRSTGIPVLHADIAKKNEILEGWLAEKPEGVACVIGDPAQREGTRVRSLTPALAKGLEFDLVILVDPRRWSAVDRYVAMTRATERLVVLDRGSRVGP